MSGKSDKNIRAGANSIFFEIQEEQWLHNPYGHELREQSSIRMGNIEALKMCWKETYPGKVGRLASDSLRSMKNLAVCIISISARSAIEGGVSPEMAFSMADAYIRNMEDKLFEENEVFQSIHDAQLEFAKVVKELGGKSLYNPVIRRAKDYISRHMHDKISVSKMAHEIGVNPDYLSSLFSRSENKTITEYILNERLYLCENMLKYSDYSIQEISAYFAFSSQSHFTKLFKRSRGITPSEYRRRYKRE